MGATKKSRVAVSIGIFATGVLALVLLPNSTVGGIAFFLCIVVVVLRHLRVDSSSIRTPATDVQRSSRRSDTRADVVSRYLSSLKAGDKVENKVNECLREIAGCENWLEQAPSEWEPLWRWKKRVVLSDEVLAFERTLEQQFRSRERELEQRQVERDTETLWQAHLSTINKFFEIAERKVSILDDYGDERWDLLPREIAACLLKISTAEGMPIPHQELRNFRKNGQSWGLPKEYNRLATRLKTAFVAYHGERRSDRPDQSLNGLSGSEFETHVAHMLNARGYEVSGTPATGDQGADLIAKKAGRTIVVQAKRYKGAVGNKAVQEIAAAVNFYSASEGWVITNADFTPAAKALAQKNNVRLIGGDELARLEKAAPESDGE